MDSNTIKKAIAEKADGVYQKLLKKSSDVFLNGDFNTITLLDDSINLSALFNFTSWLENNSSISSLEEFKHRLDAFKNIVMDYRSVLAKKNMKVSCYSSLFYEHGKVFENRLIQSLEENDIQDINLKNIDIKKLESDFFDRGMKYIKNLLVDDDIREYEGVCNFQLFAKKIPSDWDGVLFYKVMESNNLCLKKLTEFYKEMVDKDLSDGDEYISYK